MSSIPVFWAQSLYSFAWLTPMAQLLLGSSPSAFRAQRVYSGRQLSEIAFPLGGIGTGTVSLGGRGDLRDWEIGNRPAQGRRLPYTFFAVWVQAGDEPPQTRVLEGALPPPYSGPSGVPLSGAGLPRFGEVTFAAAYPFAHLTFTDPDLPIRVSLEAFNPLIPHDSEASGLPVAVFRHTLTNPTGRPVQVALAFCFTNPIGLIDGTPGGNLVEWREAGGLRGWFCRSEKWGPHDPAYGTFAVTTPDTPLTFTRIAPRRWWGDILAFWDDFSEDGALTDPVDFPPSSEGQSHLAALSQKALLGPGESRLCTTYLTWHFPNRTAAGCGWETSDAEGGWVGNYYATRFPDAWAVAVHIHAALPELEATSRRFVDTLLDSTLPEPVLEAALNNLSTLRSQTCFRTADGHFFGFEGCSAERGCCYGNCTHVWNYEQATGWLFPDLARSMRWLEYQKAVAEDGAMDFRLRLPLASPPVSPKVAADGQMGSLMRLYREWQFSGDEAFLRELWPAARRALEFAWRPGSWDADQDGVMEGIQHNTYDVEFYGPNPMTGIYYLGGLRAAEEMARHLGEEDFAACCRELFERGRTWIEQHLFNGEYYVQEVRPFTEEPYPGTRVGAGADDPAHPDYQLGEGCLIDQLVGQYQAHAVGLGRLVDPAQARSAAAAIYRYNFVPTLRRHVGLQRTYALNDEAATLICTYPRGRRPAVPFPYFSEVMTGFEYQAALLLIYEGMVEEGLRLIAAIRARYDGERRNPWDEAECGSHYARAMASWGAIPALSGCRWSGVARRLSFAPLLSPQNFACFFSADGGWGLFRQGRGEQGGWAEIDWRFGQLSLREWGLAMEGREWKVVHQGQPVPVRAVPEGDRTFLSFAAPLTLQPNETLRAEARP